MQPHRRWAFISLLTLAVASPARAQSVEVGAASPSSTSSPDSPSPAAAASPASATEATTNEPPAAATALPAPEPAPTPTVAASAPQATKGLTSKSADAPASVPAVKSGAAALGYSILVPIATGAIGVGVIWAGSDFKGPGFLGGLLILGSVTVAPSAGHLYTGEFGRAALFSLGRTAALGVAVSGVGDIICFENCDPGNDGLVALGLASWAVLTLVDVIDSPLSARRANKRSLSLAPMVMQERGPDLQPITFGGLQLAISL